MNPVCPPHAFDHRKQPDMIDDGVPALPFGPGSHAQRTTNAPAFPRRRPKRPSSPSSFARSGGSIRSSASSQKA